MNDNQYFNVINGVQKIVIPGTDTYTITCAGSSSNDVIYNAYGQMNVQRGGYGRILKGEINLVKGDILYIVCGQKGLDNNSGSGGGGSFVY